MKNREIKFRGLTIDNVWVYGHLLQVESEGKLYSWIFWQGNQIPVINETVGQFIGRKDKNGKEIYEGDLRKNGDEIKYSDAWSKFGWTDGGYLMDIKSNDFIIGNIHQNKNLL